MICLIAPSAGAVDGLITWSQGYIDSTSQKWHRLKGPFSESCLLYPCLNRDIED